ncbi:CotH kinase family protein [Thalassoglobus sp. JC818]|uniref:CotH kinase family protein n=1 Tax=Thalassoglobus sp. JC818 TaxID=3232136 RepID=UPI00345A2419
MIPLRTHVTAMLALVVGFSVSNLQAQPPGGPNAPDIELVNKFDANGDGWLNAEERKLALEAMQKMQSERGGDRRRGPGGFGGPPPGGPGGPGGSFGGPPGGGPGRGRPEGTPGPRVSVESVKVIKDADLYDPSVLRTMFIEFESDGWEQEMAAFKPTDVEIPATLIVDGEKYSDVGVSFRGSSSFFMVPEGSKRSLNLSIDFIHDDQRLYGYRSLNLLNCNGDASMMSSLLYSHIAGEKIATPKVNFMKVVINGRSWGIYANAEQFNKDFLKDNFDTKKGARWKVSGNPGGDAGLRYLGDDLEPYRERFEIKSDDDEKSWRDLIHLCKVLNTTPQQELPERLENLLDLDGVLWFLAVDVALVNSDGYWTRASDYNIYQDPDGKFHILPHDMNEAFHDRQGRGFGGPPGGGFPGFGPPGGDEPGRPDFRDRGPRDGDRDRGRGDQFGDRRGFGGPDDGGRPPRFDDRDGRRDGGRGFGPPGGGERPSVKLDPLVGLDSDRFPLRSKLLANEALRTRYLQYVRLIASKYLDWDYLGPHVDEARKLIEREVRQDTRKLASFEDFQRATDMKDGELKQFCDQRAEYLLNLDVIKNLPKDSVKQQSLR